MAKDPLSFNVDGFLLFLGLFGALSVALWLVNRYPD